MPSVLRIYWHCLPARNEPVPIYPPKKRLLWHYQFIYILLPQRINNTYNCFVGLPLHVCLGRIQYVDHQVQDSRLSGIWVGDHDDVWNIGRGSERREN